MQTTLFDTGADEKIHETFIKDLKRGNGFKNGKKRIVELFNQNLPKSETIKFLKDEYGIGGRSTLASKGGYAQKHDSNGIEITIETGEGKLHTWSQVYDALSNLIKNRYYLEGDENDK